MTLYGGVDNTQPFYGYGDKGPAPTPMPQPGLGSGLGNLGNILLGYLNQPAAPPPNKLPGVVPPSQQPGNQPPPTGQPPVVLVGDPGTGGGDVGSGNNSGNTVNQSTVNIPGFGNVSFNAPSLPALPNAQFGNSPPLSLIAALGNPNFQSGGGGAPSYDTNVGSSGPVQGNPGQMIDQRRDSPGGPAPRQQDAGPAGLPLTPWGADFLGGGHKAGAPEPAAPQIPQQRPIIQGGSAPPGMPPIPGGMPPQAPIPEGGAGATESNNAVFERLKKKMQKMYQDGAITPEEMNALNGMATSSAPPQAAPPQGYGDAFTSQKTVGEVANAAPPQKTMPTGATTGGAAEESEAAKTAAAYDPNDPNSIYEISGGRKITNAQHEAEVKAADDKFAVYKQMPDGSAVDMRDIGPDGKVKPGITPRTTDDKHPEPAIQEQFPQSEPPVYQPASSATAERPYHAPYQAGAERRDRDEEIQALSKSLREQHAQLDPQKVMAAYQQAYAEKAQHPSGTNKPILDGIMRLHNRLNFGNQSNVAQYRAQVAANAYLNGPTYHQQKEDYARDYNRYNALVKERGDESQAAEKQAHTEQLAAQKQAADTREHQLDHQRTELEKQLALRPPSPITKGMIDRAAKAGLIPDDEGVKSRLYTDSYDQEAAQKDALERQKAQLAIQKEREDLNYAQKVAHPAGKLRFDLAVASAPDKKDLARLKKEKTQLEVDRLKYNNGQMTKETAAKFLARDDAHNRSMAALANMAANQAHTAWSEQFAEDQLPMKAAMFGVDEAKFMTKGVPAAQKPAAQAAYTKTMEARTVHRGDLLKRAEAARANVAKAVDAGKQAATPEDGYRVVAQTMLSQGASPGEIDAKLAVVGSSLKALGIQGKLKR